MPVSLAFSRFFSTFLSFHHASFLAVSLFLIPFRRVFLSLFRFISRFLVHFFSLSHSILCLFFFFPPVISYSISSFFFPASFRTSWRHLAFSRAFSSRARVTSLPSGASLIHSAVKEKFSAFLNASDEDIRRRRRKKKHLHIYERSSARDHHRTHVLWNGEAKLQRKYYLFSNVI